MHRIRSGIALALALAALTLVIAGCSLAPGAGSSPGASDGGTTTSTKTYSNPRYGFSITYSDRFTQGKPVSGTGAGGSSVFDVVFADNSGPVVSDRNVDAITVSVYELAHELKPPEVPKIEPEMQGIVDQLMSSLPSARVVEKLSPVKVNGVPGFALDYTYTESDTALTAMTFFLIRRKYEYQITAQATTADWDSIKGELEAAVQSFRVLQ